MKKIVLLRYFGLNIYSKNIYKCTDLICRNKNASTAAQHMGMPVLNRPYAIVLGAHEDDVNMTEGVEGG